MFFRAFIIVDVEVPRVDVCFYMVVQTRRVVLNETGGIKRFGKVVHLAHPFLPFVHLFILPTTESPSFVEIAP